MLQSRRIQYCMKASGTYFYFFIFEKSRELVYSLLGGQERSGATFPLMNIVCCEINSTECHVMHETVVRCDPMRELMQVQLPEEPHSVLWRGEDCEAMVPTHPSQARTVPFTYYSFLRELHYSPQCCGYGSGMFIPENFSIPDTGQKWHRIRNKEFKVILPKKLILSFRNYSFGLCIPDPRSGCFPSQIPDPGSGSATLIRSMKQADPRLRI
jgi:hypothetical protein